MHFALFFFSVLGGSLSEIFMHVKSSTDIHRKYFTHRWANQWLVKINMTMPVSLLVLKENKQIIPSFLITEQCNH